MIFPWPVCLSVCLWWYVTGCLVCLLQVRHKPTGQLMVLKRNKKKTVSLLKEIELLKRLQHVNILQ